MRNHLQHKLNERDFLCLTTKNLKSTFKKDFFSCPLISYPNTWVFCSFRSILGSLFVPFLEFTWVVSKIILLYFNLHPTSREWRVSLKSSWINPLFLSLNTTTSHKLFTQFWMLQFYNVFKTLWRPLEVLQNCFDKSLDPCFLGLED